MTVAEPRLGATARLAYQRVMAEIESGRLGPGDKLPGERELAEELGVGRSSLRDALAALEHHEIIRSSPWRGWFVTTPVATERVTLSSFTEMAVARGLTATATVLRHELRAATHEEAVALRLTSESDVLELHRLRSLSGSPVCVDVSVIATAGAALLAEVDMTDRSLYVELEAVCGARVTRSDYAVHAEEAGATTAEILGLRQGGATLVAEETAFDSAGVPVLLGRATYRSDAYEFKASLLRGAGAPA